MTKNIVKTAIVKTETKRGTEAIIRLYWNSEKVNLIPPETITVEIDFDPKDEETLRILKQFLIYEIEFDITRNNGKVYIHEKISKQPREKKPEDILDVNLDPVNHTQTIREFFLNNPDQKCTPRQISRNLGIENSIVNNILFKLQKNEFIQKIERGVYRLSPKIKKTPTGPMMLSEDQASEEESNEETSKESKVNEEPENLKMVKEILENYPKIVEYILTKKTFSVKALRKRFLEIDVVCVIKSFNEEVIQYYTVEDGVYTVSPKWKIWYYLLKKNEERKLEDVIWDLKLTEVEAQEAIEKAVEEKLITKIETDEVIKYSIKN